MQPVSSNLAFKVYSQLKKRVCTCRTEQATLPPYKLSVELLLASIPNAALRLETSTSSTLFLSLSTLISSTVVSASSL